MKKNNRILPLMLFILTGFHSCSDEDSEAPSAGRISFYGANFPLEQGAIYHDNNHTVIAIEDYTFEDHYEGENGEQTDFIHGFTATVKKEQTGNFLLSLYESGFIINEATKDAQGAGGACISLRFASPEPDSLLPGKYVYSPNYNEYTFKGYSSANYNTIIIPHNPVTIPNEIGEGEVNIAKEGEIYTITFDCKTTFGGPVTGTYTGTLKSFDIKKTAETFKFYKDIKLEALFDTLKYTDTENVFHCKPDYSRAKSFFSSTTRKVYSAKEYMKLAENDKKGIDIALVYDRAKDAVYFESPIKMRALLWHNTFEDDELFNYSFDLPCHTKYMSAPEDFTNADFEAMSKQEDFVFDFTASAVSICIGRQLPCFVFVQTGNGQQGVIRIKEIIPESTEISQGTIFPLNPILVMDIKFPRSYSAEQLR